MSLTVSYQRVVGKINNSTINKINCFVYYIKLKHFKNEVFGDFVNDGVVYYQ